MFVHAKVPRTADVVCVVRSRESVCELRCELLLAPRTLWGDADFLIAVAGPRRLRAAQNAPLSALPALPARLAPHAHTHMHRLQQERCERLSVVTLCDTLSPNIYIYCYLHGNVPFGAVPSRRGSRRILSRIKIKKMVRPAGNRRDDAPRYMRARGVGLSVPY